MTDPDDRLPDDLGAPSEAERAATAERLTRLAGPRAAEIHAEILAAADRMAAMDFSV